VYDKKVATLKSCDKLEKEGGKSMFNVDLFGLLKIIFFGWELLLHFLNKRKFETLETKLTDLNQRLEILENEVKKLNS
jgi:hypothetical protein